MSRSSRPSDLRILQVVLSLQPGGTERLVVELVRRLRDELPMAVCCLDDEGDWAEALGAEGVAIRALSRRPGFHPGLAREIASFARRNRTRVLHCHQYSPFVYGALARSWNRNLKVVFTEHGRLSDAPPSRKRRVANVLLSRLPAMTFAVSENLKRHLVAEGFAPGRVGVIYNGIDIGAVPDNVFRIKMRERLGIDAGTFVIGTIARLDPVKDLATLIDATVTLPPHLPCLLLVVGDGAERQRLETIARERDHRARVRFLGHRNDARDVLAACDAFVNSSVSEGISLTILEAMAAAIPVVATSVGGTPEILDETCGRLVPARDVAGLAEALYDLASRPAVRQQLGRAGRQRVETRFTLERMIHEYRDAYYRAVA